MTERYPPIADYAIIGCSRSAALISRRGSIDWLCWPRFDSPSVFARILDWDRGGYFAIQPAIPFRSSRRYVDSTNVLETTQDSTVDRVRQDRDDRRGAAVIRTQKARRLEETRRPVAAMRPNSNDTAPVVLVRMSA